MLKSKKNQPPGRSARATRRKAGRRSDFRARCGILPAGSAVATRSYCTPVHRQRTLTEPEPAPLPRFLRGAGRRAALFALSLLGFLSRLPAQGFPPAEAAARMAAAAGLEVRLVA